MYENPYWKYNTYAPSFLFFFFFNDTATTEIYTLSLHDALPICLDCRGCHAGADRAAALAAGAGAGRSPFAACGGDRKSTRLNSSHLVISYAVFCLKKKKTLHSDPSNSLTSLRDDSST